MNHVIYSFKMNKKLKIKNQYKTGSLTNKRHTGFTLIELVVSLGLFIVVMMISTGALLSLSATNDKVSSMRIAIDNLNLALDSMSREIRMGTAYHCDYGNGVDTDPRDCDFSNSADSFTFKSQKGGQMVYRLNSNDPQNKYIERSKNITNTNTNNTDELFYAMTAPELNIDYLTFIVVGADVGNNDQPRVIISIGGTAGVKEKSKFNIQTTVTQKRPK